MTKTNIMPKLWLTALLVALLAILLCVSVGAETVGETGTHWSWSLDTETGELSITGTGTMWETANEKIVPWAPYRASIQKVTIGEGITSIAPYSFYNCTNLVDIYIPQSVVSVRWNCRSLRAPSTFLRFSSSRGIWISTSLNPAGSIR